MGTGSVAAIRPQGLTLQVEQSELLKRIREGETELFGQVVHAHQKRIFRVALYYVRDPAVADTLTQDTFIRAFEHIGRFRGDAQLETWLTRIAINLCLTFLKKRQRELKRSATENFTAGDKGDPAILEVTDTAATPEEQLLRRETMHRIERAVSLMSGRQKTVFLLRHYEGLSLEEIGRLTRMNIGTVKSHLFRALQKVREMFKDNHGS